MQPKSDATPNIEPLVRALARVIDREAKKHGLGPVQVCGALGAVAGGTVAANVAENGGVVDTLMLGAVGMAFDEVVRTARQRRAN